MIRNFEIHNDRLKSVKYPKGVTGNVNTYVCHFDIACDIPDLIWFCVFKQGDIVYRQTIENNTCKIPQEVLVNTEPLYIGCYGTNAKDDIKRVSTNLIFFDVKEGAYSESTMPDTPTPDMWETLVSKTIPIIGDNGNWYIWDMAAEEYVDSGYPASGSGGGEDIDLSGYYTAKETDSKLKEKEDMSNKILAKDEDCQKASYYSAKATHEYVAKAIKEVILDSWGVGV